MIDISEQCGHSITEQLSLFESIKPLFANKQLILVANKTDAVAFADVREADRLAIEAAAADTNAELMQMSNVSEDGVMAVKTAACDKLLQARVDARMVGKKVSKCASVFLLLLSLQGSNRIQFLLLAVSFFYPQIDEC